MATIYEITEQASELYELLLSEEIDEQTFTDTLESITTDKVENYCKLIRQLAADELMYKTEAERLSRKRKICENTQQRLKNSLLMLMESVETEKLKAGMFTISTSANQSVNIINEAIIPQAYRIPQPDKIDKMLLKTALRTINVPGAEIISKKGIRIR